MLSPPVGTLATTNTEVNLPTTLGTAAALNPSQGTDYILSNIGCQITRYELMTCREHILMP